MENLEVLRSRLVDKIFSTHTIDLLKTIEDIFSSVPNEKNDAYLFSDSQKEMLLLAEEDIKYGRTISDEELKK